MKHRRRASWRIRALTAVVASGLCGAAHAGPADSPSTTTLAAPAIAPPTGVTSYPAAYFAPMGAVTAYDMVLRLPGFAFDDGSAVRGFAGAAGNVLIDGERPTSKTDDLASILQRLAAAQVARIDVIRGGAPGIDMQGKTVVANLIRKRGAGFSGLATFLEYSTAQGYNDPQGQLKGTWTWDGGRSLELNVSPGVFHDNTQGSGPHLILSPSGQTLDASQMRNRAIGWQNTATAVFETPAGGGRLRANFLVEDQPYKLFNLDDFQAAGLQSLMTTQDQQDAEFGLHYERPLGGKASIELLGLQHLNGFSQNAEFDTQTDAQNFRLKDQGGESIGRAILHWRSDRLSLEAGGEYAYNWLKTRTEFIDNGAVVAVPAADVRVEEGRGEAFATATWQALKALSIEAGLRVERSTIKSRGDVNSSRSFVFPKPRLVVTWTPDAADQVRLRVEREVGQLDFKNFAANAALNLNGVVAGNPNMTPQQDWAFEAAYDRHFLGDGIVSVTLRRLALTDVIDQVPIIAPSGVFDAPGNIGGGAETDLIVRFNLPLQRFGLTGASLSGGGTWRISRVTDPTTGQRRPISVQHQFDGELHFNQDLPRWKLTWGAEAPTTAFVERSFRFDEIDSNAQRTFWDVFVERRLRPDLSLRVELDSPLDLQIERQVFAGPRGRSPFLFTDVQNRRFGPDIFTRLRKTFG